MSRFVARSRAARPVVLLLAVAGLGVLAGPAQAAPRTFPFFATGDEQVVTVPAGVTSVDVTTVGGRGGSPSPSVWPGGFGARSTGTLSVTPGQKLYVEVGGNGSSDASVRAFNGGGMGGLYYSGGGGGATDVRLCPRTADACAAAPDPLGRVVVAGGGGGGTKNNNDSNDPTVTGGGLGGTAGATATDGTAGYYWTRGAATGGGGATTTAGGAAGDPGGPIGGALLQGGDGGNGETYIPFGGGGGGGGVYGGGGGGSRGYYGGGGGAGSSLAGPGGTLATDATGTPRAELTFEAGPPTEVSTPTLSRASVYADGTSTATATVKVTGGGLPYPGEQVTFTATAPAPTIGPVTNNGDGTYTVTLTASSTAGLSEIRAHDPAATVTPTSEPTTLAQLSAAQVTSPTDGATALDAVTGGGSVTVSGTADAFTRHVDLACYDGYSYHSLGGSGSAVPVTNGRWTAVDVPISSDDTFCHLLASPNGLLPNADSTGPTLRRLVLRPQRSQTGALSSFEAAAVGTAGLVTGSQQGRNPCSLTMATVTGFDTSQAIACANGLTGNNDWAVSTQPAVTIDGTRAYMPSQSSGDATSPTLTLDRGVAPDGSLSWTERAQTAFSSGTTATPPYANAGVAITVRTTVSPSGLRLQRLYTLRSTDGQPHTVRLAMGIQTSYGAPRYRIGSETDYTTRPSLTTVPVPTGDPFTIRARDNNNSTRAYATFTMAEAPNELQTASQSRIVQRYVRTVPATGSVPLAFTAELTDPTDAATDAAAARGQAAFDPAPAISAPATTSAATATVTGTVRPGSTVTVNGAAVPTADDGTWTLSAPLTMGPNTFAATETTVFGKTASTSATVTRVEPPPPEEPVIPDDPTKTTPDTTVTIDPPTATTPAPPSETTPTVPTTPAKPSPPKPALLRLTGVPATLRTMSAIKRGVPVTATLGAPGAKVTAVLLRPGSRTPLGQVVRTRVKAGKLVLRVKLPARAARTLRGKRTVKLTLRVTAKPVTGAAVVVTRTITLRR